MAGRDGIFIRACRMKKSSRTPVWFMRQAGRFLPEYRKLRKQYGFMDIVKDPKLAAAVTLMPVERLGVDAAILFSDIMTPLEGMGVRFRIEDGIGPVVDAPVRDFYDVESLRELDPYESTAFVMEAVRRSKRALHGRTPLIGFAGAPFTLATYLVEGKRSEDLSVTKSFMHSKSDAWHALMERLAAASAEYLSAQVLSGADAVQLFDSWAGGLSPADYEEYVLPYVKDIFRRLRGMEVPTIYFSTGTSVMLDSVGRTGANVISVDWRIDIGDAWDKIGKKALQGNLDPALMLCDIKTIRERAGRILDRVGGRPGHIFNLGHGMPPTTPVDNAAGLVSAVHEYGAH